MLQPSSVLPHSKKLQKTDFKKANHVIKRKKPWIYSVFQVPRGPRPLPPPPWVRPWKHNFDVYQSLQSIFISSSAPSCRSTQAAAAESVNASTISFRPLSLAECVTAIISFSQHARASYPAHGRGSEPSDVCPEPGFWIIHSTYLLTYLRTAGGWMTPPPRVLEN